MRSSSGQYFAGLDQVRGVAAFLVVLWHFAHWTDGAPVPFNQNWWWGPLDEGHVGVSVFMVLSGYLFAKLIGDRQIDYIGFLWNRALRLAPLLLVTMTVYGLVNTVNPLSFIKLLIGGVVLPQLPNGGWSITVEAHFYLLLPLALAALRRDPKWALAFLTVSLSLRAAIFLSGSDVQYYAYLTIIGRIDQFVLGIVAFQLSEKISGKLSLTALAGLYAFYVWFDMAGGYYNSDSPAPWIIIPTIEAVTISAVIAWYDRNAIRIPALELAGKYSYSIYLLHFFLVHQAAMLVNDHIMTIDTLLKALPWAVIFFASMMLVGAVSWKLIEEPPLRWRKPYLRSSKSISPNRT